MIMFWSLIDLEVQLVALAARTRLRIPVHRRQVWRSLIRLRQALKRPVFILPLLAAYEQNCRILLLSDLIDQVLGGELRS